MLADLGAARGLYQDLAATGAAALADDGQLYSTVQSAVDAATGFVLVAPGTHNEAVTISTTGLQLVGNGQNTVIDGGTTGTAITTDSTVTDVTIRNLVARTTGGGGSASSGLRIGSNDSTIQNVTVPDADRFGVNSQATNVTFNAVTVEASDSHAFYNGGGDRNRYLNCRIGSGVKNGINDYFGDTMIANCHITGANIGIYLDPGSADTVVIGNRIHNCGTDGIEVNGTDQIIANNRVSGSATNDIELAGTTTTTDANLTGASN